MFRPSISKPLCSLGEIGCYPFAENLPSFPMQYDTAFISLSTLPCFCSTHAAAVLPITPQWRLAQPARFASLQSEPPISRRSCASRSAHGESAAIGSKAARELITRTYCSKWMTFIRIMTSCRRKLSGHATSRAMRTTCRTEYQSVADEEVNSYDTPGLEP
jgi:hypothetical protein